MAIEIRLPKIKFCGLTRSEDVRAAIECGANAIGLNFFRASPRYVSPESARELSLAADRLALRVGVFVNAAPTEVAAVLAICPLDCIQLHGDESPDWIDQASVISSLKSILFIKAVAWRDKEEDRAKVLAWTQREHARLLGLLIDAYDPVQRGGTGKTARWDLLFPRPKELRNTKILLAGGLTPENISQAIYTAKPDGVDVASGIEAAPGIKDHSKMRTIAEVARQKISEISLENS